jgi:hypothetical protein
MKISEQHPEGKAFYGNKISAISDSLGLHYMDLVTDLLCFGLVEDIYIPTHSSPMYHLLFFSSFSNDCHHFRTQTTSQVFSDLD